MTTNDRRSSLVGTDLKMAQIDLQHSKKATYTYCRDLRMSDTHISLLQEPWIRGNEIHGFGQLNNRLFYYRTGIRPRAAIHVSPNLHAMFLNQLSNDDLAVVRICRKAQEGGDFIVVSAYLPYDSPLAPPGPELEKVIDFCSSSNLELLVGTDSNAHHTVWGSTNINKRGEELLQFLATSDLIILNRGRKPTFVNAVRQELLDISLATPGISDKIHSWRVTDEETFSEHKLIKFCLKDYAPQRKPYRNPRKTDWGMYRELLRVSLAEVGNPDRFMTSDSLNVANDKITMAMVEAYEAACPLITPKPLYKRSLWNNDLDDKKKAARKAWNRAGKSELDEDYAEYRALQKVYKQSQKDLRDKEKKQFFEEANSIPTYA